jgi:hypothetical protein
MALTAASMFAEGSEKADLGGIELVRVGSERLGKTIEVLSDSNTVRQRLQREREGWDIFYDVLDALEKGLEEGDEFAESMREKARDIIGRWKIRTVTVDEDRLTR